MAESIANSSDGVSAKLARSNGRRYFWENSGIKEPEAAEKAMLEAMVKEGWALGHGAQDYLNWQEAEENRKTEEPDFAVIKWFASRLQDKDFRPSFFQARYLFYRFVEDLMSYDGVKKRIVDKFNESMEAEVDIDEIFPGLSEHENYVRYNHKGEPTHHPFDYIVPPGHPVFEKGVSPDLDERFALYRVGKVVLERMVGTQEFDSLLKWYLDNYEKFGKNLSSDNRNRLLDLVLWGVDNDATAESNLKTGRELAQTLHRLLKKGKRNGDYQEMVDELLGLPSVLGYVDTRLLVFRGVISEQDSETGKMLTGYLIARYGLGRVLDDFRKVYYDQKLNKEERQGAYKWLLRFWQATTPASAGSSIPEDERRFYDEVAEESHPMTEEREGDRRVQMLLKILSELGVGSEDLIIDVACGSGWLTGRLRNQGYKVLGVDNNDKYLARATEKYGNYFSKGDMLHLRHFLEKNGFKPKVEIINGRSVQHIRTISDTWEFDSDIVIFDALDPYTGIQGERLKKTRDFLAENFGFDKDWLEENFWNILGSIDNGKTLMDRFCPPEDWWKMEMESRGYKVKTIREYNFDGTGTDNLVFICQKLPEDLINEGERNAALLRAVRRREEREKGASKFYFGSYARAGY